MQATIPLCESEGEAGGWLWTLAHVWQATVALLRGAPDRAEELLAPALEAGRRRDDPLATARSLTGLCLYGCHQQMLLGVIEAVPADLIAQDADRAVGIFMQAYAQR